ncbi:hypothetical protein JOB18_046859 [Solea senegalensis]|uniref:Uncharacterized protein n=1 Tax=Solea senegalensis TaxID=28829 RepID=A0AAV6QY14_SOLSE|nr:hypothetical protein JOB18_046859 [Solea senegalensis]
MARLCPCQTDRQTDITSASALRSAASLLTLTAALCAQQLFMESPERTPCAAPRCDAPRVAASSPAT